jgi:hypothetical protein
VWKNARALPASSRSMLRSQGKMMGVNTTTTRRGSARARTCGRRTRAPSAGLGRVVERR